MEDTAASRIRALLSDLEVELDPPAAAVAEAAALVDAAARPGAAMFDDGTEDLTALPFVTIDNDDSRDLDQAVFIEPNGAGLMVWYALADAAYFVRPGTQLFEAALARGSSIYAPIGAAPMLPRSLSEGLVSLNPGVERRALVFVVTLDADCEVAGVRLTRGKILSRAKLTYSGVQALHDCRARGIEHALEGREFTESLLLLSRFGAARIELGRQRGALDFERRELELSVDPADPRRLVAVSRDRLDAERWNEQLSLLVNVEGARLLERYERLTPELQAVFRVHLPPLVERVDEVADTIGAIVAAQALPEEWLWDPTREALAAYVDRLPRGAATERVRRAIEGQVRAASRASEFSARPGPHHALGVDAYARFSAPMREVVGIFSHKELLEVLELATPLPIEQDEALRVAVIEAANRSRRTQRRLDAELELWVIEQTLADDLGVPTGRRPRRRGTLVGLRSDRLYVALDALVVDLKVYLNDLAKLTGGTFEVGAATVTERDAGGDVVGTLRVGDAVDVCVQAYDSDRRRYVLSAAPAAGGDQTGAVS
ncbi:MAG: RNB domain-containing ribonuclease [Myxococcales bacterium]|nr:RNB domain-containing ribonuclease [Myxococcales bacterium]MCB9530832.1 RNB domain-containing ribonuclease [Myxococcales bacterium]